MKQHAFNGFAGCVQRRTARSTGSEVSVYNASQAGLEDDPEVPWIVVCEKHSQTLSCSTLRLAKHQAAAPRGVVRRVPGGPVKRPPAPRIIVGVDGEGMSDGPRRAHRYFMMGAATEDGEEHSIDNLTRLSTVDCLEFLLRFAGRRYLVMSYAFGYDITKIVEDLPDRDIYLLMRPELRKGLAVRAPGARRPRSILDPVRWNGYALNMQGSRFEVSHGEGRKKRRTIVWDLFRFFQTSFVGALEAWNIGSPALRKRMAEMKKNRPTFNRGQLMQIRRYCLEECVCMVDLARALINAHEDAGIPLRKFYGAGSSGEAMLHALGVAPRDHAPIPEGMRDGLARSFFGGRFEVGRLGIIR